MMTFRIEFITPLFSKGAYETTPEIRPASIRGQLHWWFRILGHSYEAERFLFGSLPNRAAAGPATASPLVVRVANIAGQTGMAPALPHKTGGQASPKACYLPGSSFDLHLLERLKGFSTHRAALEQTLEAWLLLGSLGLRSTRAAGSFTWQPVGDSRLAAPSDFEEFERRCEAVLKGSKLRFALLNREYSSAEEARRDTSDTIGGKQDRSGDDSLARIRHPLGRMLGGRKTSPLRFRIVAIGGKFRVAALWDDRKAVTKNESSDLGEAIGLLEKSNKSVGRQLRDSSLG